MKKQSLLFSLLFVMVFHINASEPQSKKITVIGTGYVGLVLGASLADYGHEIICADIDQKKIQSLNNLVIPIYEPGLEELVSKHCLSKKLVFTSDLKKAIQSSEVIFICVGTPSNEEGKPDTRAVEAVAKTIGMHLNGYKVILTKSTVPIGTGKKIAAIIKQFSKSAYPFDIASNPEFLREGSALADFMKPERTIVGVESQKAKQIIQEIYWPLIETESPFLYTKTLETAEAIKYASNAFLAVKVCFINEMANLCEAVGADVLDVSIGMGLDKRISPHFLNPGPGFGGSCFPKDTLALAECGKEFGVELLVVSASIKANENQKKITFLKLEQLCDFSLQNKTIAVLGLSFKANTDDVRDSPSITVIENILQKGGHIKAYDPQAMKKMQQIFPQITYCESYQDAVTEADAIIVLTDWDEFKSININELESLVGQKVLLDARNIFNPQLFKKNKWKFSNFARKQ